jgi:hypothetical protein
MQTHEGESILSYLLSVPALGKTKPPSGGSQAAFSTLATNNMENRLQIKAEKVELEDSKDMDIITNPRLLIKEEPNINATPFVGLYEIKC